MKISVSIMAHPDRGEKVVRLICELGALGTPVAWDSEGPPSRDPERLWRTARDAWSLHDPAADWHLLLQDDAILSPGLMATLPAALAHVPDRAVVSLYAGANRPLPRVWHDLTTEADTAGAAWMVAPLIMWGVALLVPTALIGAMIGWCDQQRGIPDDMRVGRWARRSGLESWYTWPSLVDHPDGDSLIGHGPGRTARRFAVDGAAGIDWAGPVVRWRQRTLQSARKALG